MVKEEFKNRGVGNKLLRRAIEESERQGALEVHVWTKFDDQQAISFYIKHGFKKMAILLERETS